MSEVLTRWEMFFGAYWDVDKKLPWPLWNCACTIYLYILLLLLWWLVWWLFLFLLFWDRPSAINMMLMLHWSYNIWYRENGFPLWKWSLDIEHTSCANVCNTYFMEAELLARNVQLPGHQMPDSFQNFQTYFIATLGEWLMGVVIPLTLTH